MGLLLGLDAVRFLLLVDPPQGLPAAPGGLMGGLRQYLPQPWARPDQARGGPASAQQTPQAHPAPVRTLSAEYPPVSCWRSTLICRTRPLQKHNLGEIDW